MTSSADAPLRLRDAAAMVGLSPRALKHRLRCEERATGKAFMLRHGARGKLYTTLSLCRLAFGDDFGSPTMTARLDELEARLKFARRDINALGARVRKILNLIAALMSARDSTHRKDK